MQSKAEEIKSLQGKLDQVSLGSVLTAFYEAFEGHLSYVV